MQGQLQYQTPLEHFSTAALGKAWLSHGPCLGGQAELRKAFEKVGTRIHKREPNLKKWTIRKVAAGPVRLTTSECLTNGPVLAISAGRAASPRRPPLKVMCTLQALLVDVCVSQAHAALPQRLELRRTGIQLELQAAVNFSSNLWQGDGAGCSHLGGRIRLRFSFVQDRLEKRGNPRRLNGA